MLGGLAPSHTAAMHPPEPPRPPRPPRPYRRTLLDRLGPDSFHVLKAAGWSCFGAIMMIPVTATHSPFGWPVAITIPLVFLLSWAGITAVALLFMHPAAIVAQFYLLPTGASTPYQEQFSREQALVMQGRVPEALALFEQRIAADPGAVEARIQAAELYATHGANPARAAGLFREVQRLPGLTSGQDMYVGNRLADLYVGPLATPARALVELRRLLDRYPDSRMTPQLRQAITTLKARHVADDRHD